MTVKYGGNSMGFFGSSAFIYMELSGDRIEDGAVVAPWAEVYDISYYDENFNKFHNSTV